ncbi:ATP-binding protein [Delftia sp. PS-11]|uniref:ATP-binding protein n=1 Tax=Delftia sp. PS-11 TaxID=2767222 RepID=UPI002457840D|nr:ATP-binding protein [Delftia sp. PS-11]KAJ8744613.1 ATP-binding protein [Delftia sp. PS-11]
MSDSVFRLDFSNRVIEHLGIKLYQNKPTNVIAEFLSNCWDADASKVAINLKATDGEATPSIVVCDNGRGMSRDELINEFLVIGRNRREKPDDKTPGLRLPMGRKGIGKLAGFGIAHTVDIVSIPNNKLRKKDGSPEVYWLRFHLDKMLEKSAVLGPTGYEPVVLADGISLDDWKIKCQNDGVLNLYSDLIASAEAGEGGVCIHLHDTTLKKAINADALLRSLGARFTVTLLRSDFEVKVNGKGVNPNDAFPAFQDFSIGSFQSPNVEKIKIGGVDREVRFWARFVALSDADWPLENAGVGVYAHGKIAQDRPFFFNVRGKEIFGRYLYAVIEADWLDELDNDVVSTDRRSVNWDTDETIDFHKWGVGKVNEWIESFKKWRKEQPKKEIVDRVRRIAGPTTLSAPEEQALAELLSDLLPNFGNDEEAKDRATQTIKSAWVHEPTRQLTKRLWKQVFSEGEVEGAVFADLVEKLRDSLIPEAMSLAVTMAQRIAAITAMRKIIESEKTETHLQRLVEKFPWLLGPEWEKLTANQTIRTLIKDKHVPSTTNGEWKLDDAEGGLKPDFVFLSDIGEQQQIVVFELKGPEAGKTLQISEFYQLRQYLDIISGAYPHLTVTGFLIGHDAGGFKATDTRITVGRWSEVLGRARLMHASYLGSLLSASEAGATDERIKQIANFGGAETMELLEKLHEMSNFPSVVLDALKKNPNLAIASNSMAVSAG